LELDRSQHECPANSAIAQQYSSATFVLLRFRSRQEIFGALQNFFKFYSFVLLFKNVISLKLLA
jgi:hypothetical protein